MNTLWHAFWTYALFRKKKWWWKAVLFSIVPDLIWVTQMLILLGNGTMKTLSLQVYTLFPFTIPVEYGLHSTLLFLPLLALAIWWKKETLYGYFWGWGFHLFSDYLSHLGDSYWPFYPLNHWQVRGLISYWEPQYYANEFNVACYGLAALLAWYWICYPSKVNLRDILFSGLASLTMLAGLIFFPLVHHTPWSLKFLGMPLVLFGILFAQHTQQLKTILEEIRQRGVLRTVGWLLNH